MKSYVHIFFVAVVICLPMSAFQKSEVLKEKLVFQLEEEKMAMDFFNRMYEKYELLAFKNLAKCEERHMRCIVHLIENLEDLPELNLKTPGRYMHKEIGVLYETLVKQGETSLIDALEAGAYIQEKSISNLDALIKIAGDDMIKSNMVRLRENSRCNLHLMVGHLNNRNTEYRPVILTVNEYLMCIKGPVNQVSNLPDCPFTKDDCPFKNN